MTWLVTGGAGYIGSHVVKELQQNGFKVIVLDDLSTGKQGRISSDTIFYRGDVLNKGLLFQIFQDHKVEGIVHLAGKKNLSESLLRPNLYFEINSIATEVLIDAAIEFGVKKVVFSSTAAVYAEQPGVIKYQVDSLKSPATPYGLSKLFAERLLEAHVYDGLDVIILRYFNVTGFTTLDMYDQNSDNLLSAIRESLNSNRTLEVFGLDYETIDGSCVRDYIHVEDLSRVHLKCIELITEKSFRGLEVFNVGTGVGHSVLQVIATIEKKLGIKIPWRESHRREGDSAQVVCDIQESTRRLNWTPRLSPFREV
jgi:UDP-glucose 4-epimerase